MASSSSPFQSFGRPLYRPPTAPPASLPPDLVRRASSASVTPPVPLLPLSSSTAALSPSSLSSLTVPSSSARRPTSRMTVLNPAFALNLRSYAEEADDDAAGGPPSPLETSIHISDVLNRGRAVPIVRAEGLDGSHFAAARGREEAATPPASTPKRVPTLNVNSDEAQKAGGKKDEEVKEDEPLTGDKGETASEVAAMFAGW
ncbi:hypothetical protein JCM11251_007171 [Rhodosporidiobolus azoricus]